MVKWNRRFSTFHKSPHTYILISILLHLFFVLIYLLQPFMIYIHNPFSIDDNEIELLESVGNFDVYIINRNSDIDVVYLHGSRISASNHLTIAKNLEHNVILPFYPGYCTSEGICDEIEIKRCMLILSDILKKRGNKVRIFAQSIGTAVAYYLSNQIDYEKMVLENSIICLFSVIKRRWYGILYIFVYDRWLDKSIDEKNNITYLISEFDDFVGKDISHIGSNDYIILEGANHFNAYKKVKNYYKIINDALNME